MKTLTWIMSPKIRNEYWESYRARSPSRNQLGKGVMIDEVSGALSWDPKRSIRSTYGKVSL